MTGVFLLLCFGPEFAIVREKRTVTGTDNKEWKKRRKNRRKVGMRKSRRKSRERRAGKKTKGKGQSVTQNNKQKLGQKRMNLRKKIKEREPLQIHITKKGKYRGRK